MAHRKTVPPGRSLPSYNALEKHIVRLTEERDALTKQRDALVKQLKESSEKQPVLPQFVEAVQNFSAFYAGDLTCSKGDIFRVVGADERYWHVMGLISAVGGGVTSFKYRMPRRIGQSIDGNDVFELLFEYHSAENLMFHSVYVSGIDVTEMKKRLASNTAAYCKLKAEHQLERKEDLRLLDYKLQISTLERLILANRYFER